MLVHLMHTFPVMAGSYPHHTLKYSVVYLYMDVLFSTRAVLCTRDATILMT